MKIEKDMILHIFGQWHMADVIMPGPGSEHDVPSVVPETLRPVDLESLPITAQHRRLLKAKFAEFQKRMNREH